MPVQSAKCLAVAAAAEAALAVRMLVATLVLKLWAEGWEERRLGEGVAVVVQVALGAVGAEEATEMQRQAFDALYLCNKCMYMYMVIINCTVIELRLPDISLEKTDILVESNLQQLIRVLREIIGTDVEMVKSAERIADVI